VVISQGQWTQISHHWFTTLFSMIAVWATLVSVERAQPWLRGRLVNQGCRKADVGPIRARKTPDQPRETEAALATSLLVGLCMIVVGLPGGLLWLTGRDITPANVAQSGRVVAQIDP